MYIHSRTPRLFLCPIIMQEAHIIGPRDGEEGLDNNYVCLLHKELKMFGM